MSVFESLREEPAVPRAEARTLEAGCRSFLRAWGPGSPTCTKQSFDISWLPGPLFFICKARPREVEAQCR